MIHFHLIIDDSNRQFFINESANGMRMHYEMQLAARMKNRRLRDTDFWAESREAILDHMKRWLPIQGRVDFARHNFKLRHYPAAWSDAGLWPPRRPHADLRLARASDERPLVWLFCAKKDRRIR